jgi:hypothetical protein
MKVYLLDVPKRGPRFFMDEKSLISYLNNDKNRSESIGSYRVRVLEAEVELTTDGSNYLETYEKTTRETNLRETKLNVVLGDEYATAVDKLISYIKENAKETLMLRDFLKELELVPVEKKAFSKFISNCADYLLYQVSDKVEYYKLLLAVHNFRKINDRYTVYVYDKFGKICNYSSGRTPDVNKNNFLLAKNKH